MTTGPIYGRNIAITLPRGKTIYWTAYAQSAGAQFVEIRDTANKVIVSKASAGNTGRGGEAKFGEGSFVAEDANNTYYVSIGVNNGASWEKVLYSYDELVFNGVVKFGNYIFGGEDGTDNDFNDTNLNLHWYDNLG